MFLDQLTELGGKYHLTQCRSTGSPWAGTNPQGTQQPFRLLIEEHIAWSVVSPVLLEEDRLAMVLTDFPIFANSHLLAVPPESGVQVAIRN
jgi:hypothetical protein